MLLSRVTAVVATSFQFAVNHRQVENLPPLPVSDELLLACESYRLRDL
jgi:hypothetical protein